MIATFRAELVRLTSRRGLFITLLTIVVVGLGAPAVVLASAKPARESGGSGGGFSRSVEALSAAGGGSEIFRYAAAFGGTLVFVVFTGLFAAEQARGTYRTMLLRQPHRLRLLAGKFAALLTYAGVTLAAIEILMWFAARVEAPIGDVSTGAWASMDGFTSGLEDYVMVLAWITGYAIFGIALGVLIRSVPVALAVGIAWAGPIEHLVSDSWSGAREWFPGLLLEAVGNGGAGDVSVTRALLTTAVYVAVVATAVTMVFRRRDVTA